MKNNWIWAGSFLVLAVGGIGFGAKAGVESGQAALRRAPDREKTPAAEVQGVKVVGPAAAPSSPTKQENRPDVMAKSAADPSLERPGVAGKERPKFLEFNPDYRAERAPIPVPTVRPVPRGVRPAEPAGRLFTPASEWDINFATGRIDRPEPRREAKVEAAEVEVPLPADGAGAEEVHEETAEQVAEPAAEGATREPADAEPTAGSPDVEDAKPMQIGEEEGPTSALSPMEDQTEGDLVPYAARVDATPFGSSPARI